MHLQRRFALTRRHREAGLTGENVLLLMIGAAVVAGIGWFALRDAAGTEDEARAYAEQTLRKLCVAHDAAYFDRNLSARGRMFYPESQQRMIFYNLTRMGVPTAPWHLDGTLTYAEVDGEHHPQGHYEATVHYAKDDAQFALDVSRYVGNWRIDLVTATWTPRDPPVAAVPSL